MLRMLVPLLAVWAGLLPLSPAAAAEPVFPPGLRIGLEPPGDLTVSKRFAGFEDFDRKAAITVLDLPGRAYQDIQRSIFAKDQPALTVLNREIFAFASGVGILVSGTGQENGHTVHKWFLLANAVGGNIHDLTTLISVLVPDAALSVYSDAVIRKTLASVTFRPKPIQEQLELLPFKITELGGFRVTQVLPNGGVILADEQSNDFSRRSYMIVSVGPGAPPNSDDRGRFARDILATAPLRDLQIQLVEPMRISGLPGYEIRALATGVRGDAVTLVQWVRFAGSGYMRIIGVTHKEDWDALFTRFRAVRDGIEFR